MPERSKIIKNISTLFSINLVSIKFCEKSKIILKIIVIVVINILVIIIKNNLYYAFVHVRG